MLKKCKISVVVALMMAIVIVYGCRPSTPNTGINVMFHENPHISTQKVYWHSRMVGTIADTQIGYNGITRVVVRLDPQFEKQAGHHWAFIVDRGRLEAERLSISGGAVAAGDSVCGFSSKAALNWFKVKTILRARVANAKRRAESLQRRFDSSPTG